MSKNKEKAGTGRKIVISLVVLLLLLTAGAYGYGVYYFSSHFLPGSMVNGFNSKTGFGREGIWRKAAYHIYRWGASGSILH